ncbi:hypothetical protein PSE_2545 [Pseudovibrio sp. FO-BEG1]|uniref:Uncharacterized protein n=2 Tax=Pseudovibrio TaxID=258255 RepID=A0A1I6Y992_9HYPH|nr:MULTISPECIES: hypothetical protein [Pseudovibrio]AEV37053.1 hypothetical protein PSE_2545 [Pseudovibrio sp. FO-BEG1]QUS57322.1 hypothetical protein KGB56_08015 [Pseudovibrio brasiliensis]SFT47058.1 hypothetical protein SAMN05444141_101718 [Pseudovibrio denitrificans]
MGGVVQSDQGRSVQEVVIICLRVLIGLGFMVFSAYVFYEAALALYKLDLVRMVGAYFLFFCTVGLGPFFWPFSWPFGDDH